MDFDLSEEHLALREIVRDFALNEIAPVAEELDQKEQFPYPRQRLRLGRYILTLDGDTSSV